MKNAAKWIGARAEAVQSLVGLVACAVALGAYDWRIGLGAAGALLYLESHPLVEALALNLINRRSEP